MKTKIKLVLNVTNHKITKIAEKLLEERISSYSLYCACKQIRCILPTQSERDGLFKFLLDANLWENPLLTEKNIIDKIDEYYILLTLIEQEQTNL